MRVFSLLGAAFLAAGCSTVEVGIGDPVDFERCAAFEPGRTTRSEVLAALGPPSALARQGDGVVMLWEHVLLEERQLGFSLQKVRELVSLALGSPAGLPGITLVKISLGRSGSTRDAALLFFDSEGTLETRSLATWSQIMGKGGAAQFVVTVESVVDSEAFRESPRSLTWGLDLLEPLPAVLNRPYAPDLELRATPDHAGQRTLEYAEYARGRRE